MVLVGGEARCLTEGDDVTPCLERLCPVATRLAMTVVCHRRRPAKRCLPWMAAFLVEASRGDATVVEFARQGHNTQRQYCLGKLSAL